MRISKSGWLSLVLGALAVATPQVFAQISLSTVVDLALRNDPKVKIAQSDLDKARAELAQAKDAYIPAVNTSGGYGASTGVPLGLPVVFSVSAQSLVFNFSQKDFVRAAGAGVAAAELALSEARAETAEDAITTYVSLDNALQRRAALEQSTAFAGRLVQIVQDRFDSGIEAHIEVSRSHHTAALLKVQKLQVDNQIASLADHLAKITSITGPHTETISDSIPAFQLPTDTGSSAEIVADSDGIRAAFENARGKGLAARGDARYRLRPQIAFSATYARIATTGTNYNLYYPRFGNGNFSFNSIDLGVQITIPLFDKLHQAKARSAAADASHALFDAQNQRNQFLEGRLKLKHAASELSARAELAAADREIAQDQLDAIQIQLKAGTATPEGQQQMTPKDEENARIQERQRYVELLDADLQLRQTEISLMRQNGQLGEWLRPAITTPAGLPAAPTAPSAPIIHP